MIPQALLHAFSERFSDKQAIFFQLCTLLDLLSQFILSRVRHTHLRHFHINTLYRAAGQFLINLLDEVDNALIDLSISTQHELACP